MEREVTQQERQQSRKLWEEVFSEDTKEFLDYYYEAWEKNVILGSFQEERLVSMIHLNPYQLCLKSEEFASNYLVAVATKEMYRHQGRMARLLKQALEKARDQACPFVFLMPAKEEIYRPFDFVTVYERKDYWINKEVLQQAVEYKGENVAVSSIYIEEITEDISEDSKKHSLIELTKFSQNELRKSYHLYAKRDEAYYRRILKEQKSQQGGIYLARYIDTKRLCGYCFFTKEEDLQLRELVCEENLEIEMLKSIWEACGLSKEMKLCGGEIAEDMLVVSSVFPCIMVRVTEVSRLAEVIPVKAEARQWIEKHPRIKVLDSYFEENQGIYKLTVQKQGENYFVKAQKLQNLKDTESNLPTFTIEEITRKCFQNLNIFLNEIV